MSQQYLERHAGLLRAWHLAVLRFALTRDHADRLGVLATANEIDRLGQHQTESGFSFFRRTSTELCAAMMRQQKGDDDILGRYLAQVEDARLHFALSAAFDHPQRKLEPPKKRISPNHDLWRGLPSRSNLNRL